VRDAFAATPGDNLTRAACFDATYYIPDDLQVKLDRASMQVALEVRCPLLDCHVSQLGAEYPTAAKYEQGLKTVLKRLLAKGASPSIARRRKQGFAVPLGRWLRGPLESFVTDSIRQQRVREAGWLDAKVATHVWETFCHGDTRNTHAVWMLLNIIHHIRDEPCDSRYQALRASLRRAAA
jgi:asparagine synthase (glutamine-hydrolysing)